ncbi:MAG: acyl-CoA thioesterase [Lachnospiraceae bacterium]|nr:acyl-CoA thioesterase [Lachnospiraceae bacterium]
MAELKPFVRKINYYETDQMHIVHHSNYVRFFEEARLDIMDQYGYDYRKIEEMGIIIPVLYVKADFKKPARYGDTIEIVAKLIKIKGLKFAYSYEIYNQETKELLVTGESGHAFLDKDLKPVRLKKDYPELYEFMQMAAKDCE